MGTQAQTPIKVAVIGMDDRSASRMNTIFKVVYKGRCEFSQVEDANLGIIDLDADASIWKTFRAENPGLPAIVMASTPTEIEGVAFVSKPANLEVLWTSIFNLAANLPPPVVSSEQNQSSDNATTMNNTGKEKKSTSGLSNAAGSMNSKMTNTFSGPKTVQKNRSSVDAEIFYDPDEYLLGRILASLKKNEKKQCLLHVDCWKDRRLILNTSEGLAYTDLTDSQLKNLGVATLSEEFVVDIKAKCGTGKQSLELNEIDGLRVSSIDYFLWDLALRTARGRIPRDTDLSSPLYLQHWPNFTRLPHTPNAMRIAALWVENPRTLDDIADNLAIERSDVYSFYSAALSIGLAGTARRQVDTLIAPRKVQDSDTSKRGLFSSILRRLKK